MGKLEPLIRHRFWLLLALTLPLALTGYFLASGDMKAATEAQEEKLASTLKGVPSGEAEPNEKYAEKLDEINKQLQEQNDVEVQTLWEAQTKRMHWPTLLVKKGYIPDQFRGEITDSGRRYYTRVYPKVLQGVWERAEPVVDDPPPPGLEVTWDQKVLLMPETIPRAYFDVNATPTNDQVWDAQEDVWLLELIFDSIARANRDANWIGEAPVRRIDQLFLTGGSGTSSVMAAAGGAMGADAAMMDEFGGMGGFGGGYDDEEYEDAGGGMGAMGSMGAMGAMGAMAGMAGGAQMSVAFDVTEEFGPPVPKPQEGAAGASADSDEMGGFGDDSYMMEDDYGMGGMGGMGMDASMMSEFGGMMGEMGAMGMGMGGMMEEFRYIGEPSAVEDAFRERGFYMSVIVLLPKLPEILCEISSSDWPIRIGRVHIGPNPYSEGAVGGGFSRGYGAGGGGGFGMFEDDEDEGGRFGGGGSRFGGGARGRGFGAGNISAMAGVAGMGFGGSDIEAMLGGAGLGGGLGVMGGLGRSRAGGGAGASLPLPRSMQGPWQIDPHWFMDPDLAQVDFCGIITMYNPVKDDELAPTADGTSEEEMEQAIAEQEEELKAAQQAAQEQAEQEAASGEATDAPTAGAAATGEPADTGAAPAVDAATDNPSAPANESDEQTPPPADESAERTPQ